MARAEPLEAGDDALTAEKVVGWYRVDDDVRRFWWVLAPVTAMVAGSVVVGVAFTQLDAIDPVGLNPSLALPGEERPSASLSPQAAPPTPVEALAGEGRPEDGAVEGEVLAQRGRVSPFSRAVRRVHAPSRGGSVVWQTWALFALGLLLVAAGPVSLVVALRRSWRDERFLLLRVDALVYRHGEGQDEVPWDDVAKVEWDARGFVALRMRDEDAPDYELRSRFAGIEPPALAARLEELRRKSTFGLLPRKRGS
ncbi:MAG: hypothetical protein KF901_01605 [Myxococcales bacterium]|nr:hypothetical protein [Myxococcales bacterium]